MSERGALRARLELLAREVAKFGVVGGVGLVVNIGVSNLLWRYTTIPTVRAGLLATFVAVLGNYIGFRYWTYRDRDRSGRTRELTLFLLFSAVGAVIETGVLYTATYGFGWDSPVQSNVFKVLGIGLATLFRFWSYRTWVFKALPVEKPAPAVETPVAGGASGAEGAGRAEGFLKQGRTEPVPRVGADSARG
ncbi:MULTISPECIES: GtrA family protein [unclassified Streptomyces]|uniref:GtrA family protein n=1 Tax=unclassified Streptomyces TaxID=2593676 RepID=UPI00324B7D6D